MTGPAREVIDLRPYAAAARPTGDWLAGRSEPAFADSGATVTALAPVGKGQVAALPAHEFLLVVTGELLVEATTGTLRIAAGRSAVLPAGLAFAWSAPAGTVVLVVASPGAPAATPAPAPTTAPTMIDETAPLTPSNPPLAELLVGPTPSCRNHTDFLAGEFVCGTWDSTPYHRRTMPYRHIELMHLLEGSVTLEGAAGSATFDVGDIFLVTRGAERAWLSTVHVKKVYAIHRPA